jgi:glucose-6-phosphate-specific signal transduction histidine kinase
MIVFFLYESGTLVLCFLGKYLVNLSSFIFLLAPLGMVILAMGIGDNYLKKSSISACVMVHAGVAHSPQPQPHHHKLISGIVILVNIQFISQSFGKLCSFSSHHIKLVIASF